MRKDTDGLSTAYKLWKQSTSQSPDPSLTSSASAPANLASTASVRSSPSPSRDSSILPSIPSIPPITAVGEIAPPPAYRERDRDQADNVDWTDDVSFFEPLAVERRNSKADNIGG